MVKYSLRCPTFGRVHTLQECLHSFLIQDYPQDMFELVIVNDYPLQTLHFDHPNVKIFNLKKTFTTIGEKENFTIENCSGDIILTWDDDDIALSNHLKNIDKYWQEGTDIMFWGNAAYYNEPNISSLGGVGNSGMVFSKKAWEKAGKSPILNAGGDMVFANKIKEFGHIVYAHPPNNEVSWFYRWSLPSGPGVYHQSGMGTDTPDRDNVVIRNAHHVEYMRRIGRIPTGDIFLKPAWRFDYQKLLTNYVNK
jgi:glycosyltransferase involved in cell wall biosynthesis